MIRFSAGKFPEKERFDAWREEFVLRIANSDISRLDDRAAPFRAEIDNLPLGRLLFAHVRGTPVRTFRDQHHVTDGNGDFTLIVSRAAETRVVANDTVTTHQGTGASLLTYWRPAKAEFEPSAGNDFQIYRYQVPRDLMLAAVPNADEKCFRPTGAKNVEALNYLIQYTDHVLLKHAFTDERVVERTGAHVLDLVATILGPSRDAAAVAGERGMRAARLTSIVAYIDTHFCNPGLDVATVARRHRVSVRYVQRAMEARGETFSHYVLGLRLERVVQMLTDPGQRALRVGDIALACGFNDLSYFNRSFRRRYGDSPRAFRA